MSTSQDWTQVKASQGSGGSATTFKSSINGIISPCALTTRNSKEQTYGSFKGANLIVPKQRIVENFFKPYHRAAGPSVGLGRAAGEFINDILSLTPGRPDAIMSLSTASGPVEMRFTVHEPDNKEETVAATYQVITASWTKTGTDGRQPTRDIPELKEYYNITGMSVNSEGKAIPVITPTLEAFKSVIEGSLSKDGQGFHLGDKWRDLSSTAEILVRSAKDQQSAVVKDRLGNQVDFDFARTDFTGKVPSHEGPA